MFKRIISSACLALLLAAGAARPTKPRSRKPSKPGSAARSTACARPTCSASTSCASAARFYYTDEKVSLLFDGNIIDTEDAHRTSRRSA
jgi:hypothetical protein